MTGAGPHPGVHALEALALAVRPEWAAAPHLGALKRTLWDLRATPIDELAGPLYRCYADPETLQPGRLSAPGPWWRRSTVSAPRQPREVRETAQERERRLRESAAARERAREIVAAAVHGGDTGTG